MIETSAIPCLWHLLIMLPVSLQPPSPDSAMDTLASRLSFPRATETDASPANGAKFKCLSLPQSQHLGYGMLTTPSNVPMVHVHVHTFRSVPEAQHAAVK